MKNQRIAQSGDFADITNSRDMVRNVAGAGMPELDTAIQGVGALSMPGQFTGAVADQYMNPYLDTVLDRQKTAAIRDFNRTGAARGSRRSKTRGVWRLTNGSVPTIWHKKGYSSSLVTSMLWVEKQHLEMHRQHLIGIDRQDWQGLVNTQDWQGNEGRLTYKVRSCSKGLVSNS